MLPKRSLFFLMLLFGAFQMQAQSFMGMEGSYWAGMSNVGRQPASILGGGQRMEFNLVGAKQQFSNNFVGLNRGSFFNQLISAIDDSASWNEVTNFQAGNGNYTAHLGAEAWGPSFMMQVDRKNAFAIGTKGRTISLTHNFSPELAELLYNDFLVPDYWLRLENQSADVQHLTWIEYFGTYARSFDVTDHHVIRAGATFKVLQGQVGAYMYLEDLDYQFHSDSLFSIYDTYIRYGLSNNPIFRDSTASPGFRVIGNLGVGFDFGVEYEFRKDGSSGLSDCSSAPYLIKVGFSMVDIGSIKFNKGPNSRDYYANQENVPVKAMLVEGFRNLDSVFNFFFEEVTSSSTFRVQLPLSFNFNVDYNIGNGFGLNADFIVSPPRYGNFERVNNISRIAITPRWEKKWFGAYMQMSLTAQTNFGLGMTLRAGPVVIGTNDILAYFARPTVYHQDLHFALKVPISTLCRKEAAIPKD